MMVIIQLRLPSEPSHHFRSQTPLSLKKVLVFSHFSSYCSFLHTGISSTPSICSKSIRTQHAVFSLVLSLGSILHHRVFTLASCKKINKNSPSPTNVALISLFIFFYLPYLLISCQHTHIFRSSMYLASRTLLVLKSVVFFSFFFFFQMYTLSNLY